MLLRTQWSDGGGRVATLEVQTWVLTESVPQIEAVLVSEGPNLNLSIGDGG